MKRGMLFVSFGTSHEDTRIKTIDAIQDKVHAAFPDYAPYSAWTSEIIVKKVKEERGEHHDTLDEALARMAADGIDDLVVVSMHLMRGAETAKVEKAVAAWSDEHDVPAYVADPLMATADDRKAVAQVICDEFSFVGKDEALLLMGHGSVHASNETYSLLHDELAAKGRERFFVATVEGEPTFDDAIAFIDESRVRSVCLAPLMIVAGDHAKNDLAGDGPDSWASQLKARGLQVKTVLRGMGEYPGIQQLACDHANQALIMREVAIRG